VKWRPEESRNEIPSESEENNGVAFGRKCNVAAGVAQLMKAAWLWPKLQRNQLKKKYHQYLSSNIG